MPTAVYRGDLFRFILCLWHGRDMLEPDGAPLWSRRRMWIGIPLCRGPTNAGPRSLPRKLSRRSRPPSGRTCGGSAGRFSPSLARTRMGGLLGPGRRVPGAPLVDIRRDGCNLAQRRLRWAREYLRGRMAGNFDDAAHGGPSDDRPRGGMWLRAASEWGGRREPNR